MAAMKSARKKLPAKKVVVKKKAAAKRSAVGKPVAKAKATVKTASKAAAKPAKKSSTKAATKTATKTAATTAAPPPVRPKPIGPAVVHWEVQAIDPAKQQTFFSDLFGWAIDSNNPLNYGMVASSEGAIGGGIGPASGASRVTFYVQVPDINAALAKAEALGARTVMPRVDQGVVIMGQFSDLEGNLIGLVEG